MDKHTTTNRAQRDLVEIKWTLEEFPSRYPRIERRLSEEVERELRRYKGKEAATLAKMARK